MRWTMLSVTGLVLTGCSPAMIAQMLPAPNLYSDPADYAHLWYQCHPGELQGKLQQCAHLADPTRDQGCALAYGAMDTAPQPATTYVTDGPPPMLNVAQARCDRYGSGPPPPSYAGSPTYASAPYGNSSYGNIGPSYGGQPARHGPSDPNGYEPMAGVAAGSYGLAPPPPPPLSPAAPAGS